MKANRNLTITSDLVTLVPYREEHVPKYHSWMENLELREATASERLSLQEEYEMQRSWTEDQDSELLSPQVPYPFSDMRIECTFIVIDPSRACGSDAARNEDRTAGMAGDANLFWNDPEETTTAEIEVMIAELASRRRGLAGEALRMLMGYGASDLDVKKYRAKIGLSNSASLALFNHLGFAEVSHSAVFKELTLELEVGGINSITWSPLWRRGTYDRI